MISGIPLALVSGLGTRMRDPNVYVVFSHLRSPSPNRGATTDSSDILRPDEKSSGPSKAIAASWELPCFSVWGLLLVGWGLELRVLGFLAYV